MRSRRRGRVFPRPLTDERGRTREGGGVDASVRVVMPTRVRHRDPFGEPRKLRQDYPAFRRRPTGRGSVSSDSPAATSDPSIEGLKSPHKKRGLDSSHGEHTWPCSSDFETRVMRLFAHRGAKPVTGNPTYTCSAPIRARRTQQNFSPCWFVGTVGCAAARRRRGRSRVRSAPRASLASGPSSGSELARGASGSCRTSPRGGRPPRRRRARVVILRPAAPPLEAASTPRVPSRTA